MKKGEGGRFFRTLSGRFLLLTVAFVMLAEVLIFLPSIARFRYDFLVERLKMAQIAALTQLAAEDMISPALEAELLANADVFNVVLRRDDVRQLVLSSPIPGEIEASYDLRTESSWGLIRDGLGVMGTILRYQLSRNACLRGMKRRRSLCLARWM